MTKYLKALRYSAHNISYSLINSYNTFNYSYILFILLSLVFVLCKWHNKFNKQIQSKSLKMFKIQIPFKLPNNLNNKTYKKLNNNNLNLFNNNPWLFNQKYKKKHRSHNKQMFKINQSFKKKYNKNHYLLSFKLKLPKSKCQSHCLNNNRKSLRKEKIYC
jgi:hypothetical protein